jgi:hypothetical protein
VRLATGQAHALYLTYQFRNRSCPHAYGTVTVDPASQVADVDPRLYGSFVEHMGRCVYEGIYEPATRQRTKPDSAGTWPTWYASSTSRC